jgi:uncharacterized membrane protein YbhN (UPF0104 family)
MTLSLLPSPPVAPRTGSRPVVRVGAGFLALALVASAGVVAIAGPDQVHDVVGAADRGPLVAALLAQLAALACVTGLYRATHQVVGGGRSSAGSGRVGLAAFGLTQALPGGGAAGAIVAACRFRQLGSSPVAATNTVVHVGLLSLAGLVTAVTLAATWAAATTGQHTGAALAGVAALLALAGGVVAVRRAGLDVRLQRQAFSRLTTARWPAILPRPAWTIEAQTPEPLRSPRELRRPFAWSLAKWGLDLVVLTLVVAAVGDEVPLAAIALAYAAVNLLNSIPLTPGGVGLVEGGMTASLHAAGLDLGTAAAVALSYRLVSYWLPLALTIPVTVQEVATVTRRSAAPRPQPHADARFDRSALMSDASPDPLGGHLACGGSSSPVRRVEPASESSRSPRSGRRPGSTYARHEPRSWVEDRTGSYGCGT